MNQIIIILSIMMATVNLKVQNKDFIEIVNYAVNTQAKQLSALNQIQKHDNTKTSQTEKPLD